MRKHARRPSHGSTALLLAMLALAATSVLLAPAWADYPEKPVRIVVPSTAGGGTDVVARLLAQHLSDKLGQQFYVENKPGAGSMTGIEAAARAAPDGYTLVMVASTFTSLHVVRSKMRFDAVKDFAPVTMIVSMPCTLVVHPSLPVASLAELIALAKRQPGQLSYGTPGLGSTMHMAMELLRTSAGLEFVHVPYNGVAPALTDVLGGRVPLMMVNAVSAKPHIDSGALRVLASSGRQRWSLLPNVPTVAESGFPDYEAVQWFGLLAPAGTPPEIVTRLHREIASGLHSPKITAWMATEGGDAVGSSPDAFLALIAAEVAKWSAVGRAAGIVPK
jgi:tripartite-type tricarboxylate transporter receptor subunit TctC